MVFVKNFKIFLISVFSLLIVHIQARSGSYSQIGDVHIVITDEKWQCDRIECPLNANRCVVSKSNEEDPAVLKRINICYSDNNEIMSQHISTTNIDPKSKIRQQITSNRNGSVSTYGTNPDFDEKKFTEDLNREMEKMKTNLNKQLTGMNKDMDRQMTNLHSNLEQMKKNIHTNLQNQMQNLDENLSKMHYDLEHMFD